MTGGPGVSVHVQVLITFRLCMEDHPLRFHTVSPATFISNTHAKSQSGESQVRSNQVRVSLTRCVCVAAEKFHIKCYGEDFLMVNNLQMDCTSQVQQACYTKGESSTCSHRPHSL